MGATRSYTKVARAAAQERTRSALLDAAHAGARHFRRLAQQVLLLHARHPADATTAIDRLLAAPESVCG